MTEYQFKNIPLSPSIAADLILKYLSNQASPTKRVDIVRQVAEDHKSLGGTVSGSAQNRVMTALRRLVDEGRISNPSFGWYVLSEQAAPATGDSSALIFSHETIVQNETELVVSELVIGQGVELVYVYFADSERKLAKFENRDWWPCKVGFTAGNLTTRIMSQGPLTSMSQLPTVGLVIKTDDGHALERILHYALGEAEATIDEALGSEWFKTSPERIATWYNKHLEAVSLLKC